MTDQPPPDRVGMIASLVKILQSMTLRHVLVTALLVVIAAPTFVLYRFMTDSSLLNKWSSFYEELASDKVPAPCALPASAVPIRSTRSAPASPSKARTGTPWRSCSPTSRTTGN
jgi:hypothetical protein